MTTKFQPEATKKYKTMQIEIAFQLAEIKSKLLNHKNRQKEGNKNYGFVGDLNYVKEQLGYINDFLS